MEVSEPSVRYRVLPKLRQTELGVFPDDWALVPLTEFYRFQNGVNADRTAYGKGVPFVNVLEVITHGRLLDSLVPGRVELPGSVLANFALRFGDVLFNRTSETQEEVGLASVFEGDAATVFGGFVIRGIPRNSRLKPNFASYVLRSPAVRAQIIARGQGAVRANVGQADLATIKVPLPDPDEQEAIAKALSDADALIESLGQLLAKKRQIKQGAMQELLTGQRRLPGFRERWVTKRLGDIAPLQRGFDLPNARMRPGPYPVVASNGVLSYHAVRQVAGPGVVTGRSGTIGKVHFVEADFWPHNTALWVTSFKGNDPKFVFFLYSQLGFERFATGSGVPTLNRNDAHAFSVPVPPLIAEQTAIAQTLSDMDAELTALEARIAKARALKQGMAQALLTGRIRLV